MRELMPVVALLLLLVIVALGGCDGGLDLQEVTGTATLDGQPLSDAAVLFAPVEGGPVAAGHTDDQGYFRLTTANQPGVPLGAYQVAINKSILHGINADGTTIAGGVTTEWIVPRRYSLPEQSGLTVQVSNDDNVFEFQLSTHD